MYWRQADWLPDGSGLVITRPDCFECNEVEPTIAVMLLDGTVRHLPFDVATQGDGPSKYALKVLGVVSP
jgi:hypothetical protein